MKLYFPRYSIGNFYMKDFLQKILEFLKGIFQKLSEFLKEIISVEETKPVEKEKSVEEVNTKEEEK